MEKHFRSSKFLLFIIVVLAAFLAAFLGQMVITLLSNRPSLLPDDSLIIRTSQEQMAKLKKAADKIEEREKSSLVTLFEKSGQLYNKVGSGFIATNDGWIVSLAGPETVTWTHLQLESGELLEIESTIVDPATDLRFVKVSAEQLHAATLGRFLDNSLLNSYISLSTNYGYQFVNNRGVKLKDDLYLSSDKWNRFIIVTDGARGDLLYNEKAELIGLVVEEQADFSSILDVYIIRKALESVLRNEEISRPELGINYIDLAKQAIDSSFTNNLTTGAFITDQFLQQEQFTSLSRAGKAYKAGLRLNDVIVSVNGDVLNHRTSLSDAILSFDEDDEIELGILRKGEPLSFKVILGSEEE